MSESAQPERVVGRSIDAHVHLWTRSTDPQPWIDPDSMSAIDRDFTAVDLASMLDRASVHSAIVVQSSNSAGETRRLLDGATDRTVGVVGWLDLTSDVPRQLDALPPRPRGRLVGVRHLVHIDPDPEWLQRPDVARGLGALGRARASFDLVVRWWQLPQVARVVGSHPEVRFVLDHLGGPPVGSTDLDEWQRSLRVLAVHPNVVAKVSGVADSLWGGGSVIDAYRPVLDVALEVFGPGRLMYGSDWPLVELSGGVAMWQDVVTSMVSGLSDHERDQVLWSTAAAAYGLSGG